MLYIVQYITSQRKRTKNHEYIKCTKKKTKVPIYLVDKKIEN